MFTQRLFKRAAVLAAQGKFTEQESAAVLRHILIYDYRPSVFDALLILSPITEPIILLRFLKSYRHQDVLNGLAMLKECGRGDLSSVELAPLTMYPQRALPSDGYGLRAQLVDASTGELSDSVTTPSSTLGQPLDLVSFLERAIGYHTRESKRYFTDEQIEGEKEKLRAMSLRRNNDVAEVEAALSRLESGAPADAPSLKIDSAFPYSSLTVAELQSIISSNHVDQKTPEQLLQESEMKEKRVQELQELGYSEDRIAEELKRFEDERKVGGHDDELAALLGEGVRPGGGTASGSDPFQKRKHWSDQTVDELGNGDASLNTFAANGGSIILDVDRKWSGLMAAAAKADGMKPVDPNHQPEDANASSSSTAAARVDLEGLSPAEAAIIEEEMRAVEAFEKTQNDAAGENASSSIASPTDADATSGFSGWGDFGAATTTAAVDSESKTTPSSDVTPAEGLESFERAMMESAAEGGSNTNTNVNEAAPIPSASPNLDNPSNPTLNPLEMPEGMANSQEASGSADFLPTCPPLPSTPLQDFDNFFRTRLMLGAERFVKQSQRGVISYERFFVIAKSYAQMQNINPEAMKLITTRAAEIVEIVLEGRDKIFTLKKDAKKKELKAIADQKKAEAAEAAQLPADATLEAFGFSTASPSTTPNVEGNALSSSSDGATTTAEDKQEGGDKRSRPSSASTSNSLHRAVEVTLKPTALAITPAHAAAVCAAALDFYSIALAASDVPSYNRKLTIRRVESAVLRPVNLNNSAAKAAAEEEEARREEALLAKSEVGGGGVASKPKFARRSRVYSRNAVSAYDVQSINILSDLHKGAHDTGNALLNLSDHCSLGDIAKGLRGHVMLVKAGFAIDRTIPMTHQLIQLVNQHLDSVLGELSPFQLDKVIALVPSVRALCASNRFPDARLLRVRIATLLQQHIFDADDETFYRFCGIAVAPESGAFGLTHFAGPEKLRMSRVLAYADSAYHRPVPTVPRRLASACELLRSVGRRRFGLARHAVYYASRAPPRTLREFVDVGRMIHYASIHPEIFNKGHGGYYKLTHMHANLLGVSNAVDPVVEAELTSTSEVGVVREVQIDANGRMIPFNERLGGSRSDMPPSATEGAFAVDEEGKPVVRTHRGRFYGLIRFLEPIAVLRLEIGANGPAAVQSFSPSTDAESPLRIEKSIQEGEMMTQNEGHQTATAARASDDKDAKDALSALIISDKKSDFASRLFQTVTPYRSSIVAAFGNEPFVLNWFIKHQSRLVFNTLISTLRTLAKSEAFYKEALRQDSGPSRKKKAAKTDGDVEANKGDEEEVHQYQQLITFILALIRFRLASLHRLAYRPKARKNPDGTLIRTNNPHGFVIKNKGTANMFQMVSEEVIAIIANFRDFSELSKIHAKAIMSLAQRTNNAGYGSLIIEHAKGFTLALADKDSLSSEAAAKKVVKKHMSLNFGQLLDTSSLNESYSAIQMIRLVAMLHDYHMAYRDMPWNREVMARIAKGEKNAQPLSDAGRCVLPQHWDRVVRGLKYRLMNDETVFDYTHCGAVITVASRIVHDALALEEDALHTYKEEFVQKLKTEEGITDPAVINERLKTLKLPADCLDPCNLKAVEAVSCLVRWLAAVPAEENVVFNPEYTAHILKLISLPVSSSVAVRHRLSRGQFEPAITRTHAFNGNKKTTTFEGRQREDASDIEEIALTRSIAAYAADEHQPAAAAADEVVTEEGEADGGANGATSSNRVFDKTKPTKDVVPLKGASGNHSIKASTLAHRISLANHFPPNSFHARRVRGDLLSADVYFSLASHVVSCVSKRKDFDARLFRYLIDAFEGRDAKAHALLKKTFVDNCDKPAGQWDKGLLRAKERANAEKKKKKKNSPVAMEGDSVFFEGARPSAMDSDLKTKAKVEVSRSALRQKGAHVREKLQKNAGVSFNSFNSQTYDAKKEKFTRRIELRVAKAQAAEKMNE